MYTVWGLWRHDWWLASISDSADLWPQNAAPIIYRWPIFKWIMVIWKGRWGTSDGHTSKRALLQPVKFLEGFDHCNTQSRGFETSRDLTVRRPSAYCVVNRGPYDLLMCVISSIHQRLPVCLTDFAHLNRKATPICEKILSKCPSASKTNYWNKK